MIRKIKNSFQFYKDLQEWFDPALEGNPYKSKENKDMRVFITITGIAQKTVCIVR